MSSHDIEIHHITCSYCDTLLKNEWKVNFVDRLTYIKVEPCPKCLKDQAREIVGDYIRR